MPPREALQIRQRTVDNGYELLRNLSGGVERIERTLDQKSVMDRLKALDRQRLLVETAGQEQKHQEMLQKKKQEESLGMGMQVGLAGSPPPPEMAQDPHFLTGYMRGLDQKYQNDVVIQRTLSDPIVQKIEASEDYIPTPEERRIGGKPVAEALERRQNAYATDIITRGYEGEKLTSKELAVIASRPEGKRLLDYQEKQEKRRAEEEMQNFAPGKGPLDWTDEELSQIKDWDTRETATKLRDASRRIKGAEDNRKLGVRRVELAELSFKAGMSAQSARERKEYFDSAFRMIKESKDEFTYSRGMFDREEWAKQQPRLSQIEATITNMLPIDAPAVPLEAPAPPPSERGAENSPPTEEERKAKLDAALDSMTPEEIKALLKEK